VQTEEMKEEGQTGPRKTGGKRIKERREEAVREGGDAMSHVQTSAWMKMKDQQQSNDEPLAFRLNPERGVKVSVCLEGSAVSSASPNAARAEEAQEKEMTRKWIPYANLIK